MTGVKEEAVNASLGSTVGEQLDVGRLVRPVWRRLMFNVMARRLLLGAAVTMVGIAAVTIGAHFLTLQGAFSLSETGPWYLLIAVAGCLATVFYIVHDTPTGIDAIRITDRALGLKDRLSAAYEYASENGRMVNLQRQELQMVLKGKRIAGAVRIQAPRREIIALLLSLLLVIVTLRLPDPQADVAASQATNHRVTGFAASAVRHLIAQQPGVAPPASTAMHTTKPTSTQSPTLKLLRNLASKLQASDSQRTALKAVAESLSQLRQIASTGTQDRAQLQAVAKAMNGGATKALSASLPTGDSRASAKAIQQLQTSVGTMSTTQRSALAQSLEQAANVASPSVKQALRKVAFSLGDNDLAAARAALQELQQKVAAAQASANAVPSALKSVRQLATIQRNIAKGVTASPQRNAAGSRAGTSGTRSSASATRGTPRGAGGNRTNGKNGAQATANPRVPGANSTAKPGAGSTAHGNNAAAGSSRSPSAGSVGTSQSGNGTGSGSAGSGTGSGSSGGTRSGNGGHVDTVYLPGKRSTAPGIVEDGPLGSSIALTSPSFQHILSQYSSAANQALGRVALPPSLQGAVKQYFSALQK
jgi:hypothetical protein